VTAAETWANTGALFAFSVLPTIIFFSSLMTLLYYLGVMQLFVKAFAWVMVRTMGVSGAESLSAAGNIFVGQTEAPLLVKPFVRSMTNSELHAVMTGGFATVAGGVMAAYVGDADRLLPRHRGAPDRRLGDVGAGGAGDLQGDVPGDEESVPAG
jgi:nucleoside permease NupC